MTVVVTWFDTKLCGVALNLERGLELEPNPSFMPAPCKTACTCLAAPSPFDVRTSQRASVEIRHWSRVKDDEEFKLLGGEKFDARSWSTVTRTPHHTTHGITGFHGQQSSLFIYVQQVLIACRTPIHLDGQSASESGRSSIGTNSLTRTCHNCGLGIEKLTSQPTNHTLNACLPSISSTPTSLLPSHKPSAHSARSVLFGSALVN